jgi:hypothetical protein
VTICKTLKSKPIQTNMCNWTLRQVAEAGRPEAAAQEARLYAMSMQKKIHEPDASGRGPDGPTAPQDQFQPRYPWRNRKNKKIQ